MKSKFRRLTLVFLLFPALFLVCFVLSDAYGILWRKEPLLFDADMRISPANAIDSGKFNSYILGTSMTNNTSAREAERLFNDGSRFANISMAGGGFSARSFPLGYLCKRGAKNVIYSLDSVYIAQELAAADFPAYIYDNNRFNNLATYFSMVTVKAIGKQAILRKNLSEGIYKDYDMPNNWFVKAEHQTRFGGLDKWLSAEFRDPTIAIGFRQGLEGIVRAAKAADATPLADAQFSEEDLARIDAASEYCREYVIKFAEENPLTQFYVFFPPYSRIRYAMWFQSDKAAALIHQEVVRFFAEMGAKYGNLHVFGFEDEDFPDDIALYIDTGHYHASINSLITAAMAAGTNMITPQNVDEYLREAELRALAFDLKGLGNEIEAHLGEG